MLDENVPASVAKALRERGFNAYRPRDLGLAGASDRELANYAVKNDFILITLDKDFGQLYFSLYKGELTVIVARVKSIPTNVKKAIVRLFSSVEVERIRGRLVILTDRGIRIR